MNSPPSFSLVALSITFSIPLALSSTLMVGIFASFSIMNLSFFLANAAVTQLVRPDGPQRQIQYCLPMSVATPPGLIGKQTFIYRVQWKLHLLDEGRWLTEFFVLKVQFPCNKIFCRLRRSISSSADWNGWPIIDAARSRRDRDELWRRCASFEKGVCCLEKHQSTDSVDLIYQSRWGSEGKSSKDAYLKMVTHLFCRGL